MVHKCNPLWIQGIPNSSGILGFPTITHPQAPYIVEYFTGMYPIMLLASLLDCYPDIFVYHMLG